MPCRTIQDEFGKFKWVDHTGRIYQGTPFSVEPDVTSKHIFVASMMHTSMRSPVLRDKPDVTCPSDFPDSERRKEVVHHEQIPDQDASKSRKNTPGKKSNVVVRWKSSGRWPLPCQMVCVLKPLTQSQQMGDDFQAEYKHKSRLVICGNFASWGEHSTTTTNLDAPLLRSMLSLACSEETTWSSIDITSAFLNADIHDDDTVLVTPPPILVKMDIVKPNTVWHVKKAIYGLQEAPRLWQQERDQKLRDLEFMYKDKLAHLVQSYIHPSLWFIAEGPRVPTLGIPPFEHSLRSDEWTGRFYDQQILGYAGVYVDDLLIAGPRSLIDSMIHAVQEVWKTSAPEHLGPDPDCVPVLRFLGMNLERVDADKSQELGLKKLFAHFQTLFHKEPGRVPTSRWFAFIMQSLFPLPQGVARATGHLQLHSPHIRHERHCR